MNDIVECYGDIYADNLIVMIAGELRKFGSAKKVYVAKLPGAAFMFFIPNCDFKCQKTSQRDKPCFVKHLCR